MSRPRQKPDYRLEKFDGELLLFHPMKSKALHLNEAASLVWMLADGNRTTSEIIEILRDAFPVQATTIGDEVESTLRYFVEQDAMEFA